MEGAGFVDWPVCSLTPQFADELTYRVVDVCPRKVAHRALLKAARLTAAALFCATGLKPQLTPLSEYDNSITSLPAFEMEAVTSTVDIFGSPLHQSENLRGRRVI